MTLRHLLSQLVAAAAEKLAHESGADLPENFHPRIDYTPDLKFGHYATPAAMELAKVLKQNPRAIAEKLIQHIDASRFEKIEIAGAGFINFTLNNATIAASLSFTSVAGWLESVKNETVPDKIIFEYVSANPTGPMNIVSARAASVGDSITRVLKAAGHEVHREYYVNDYGNQVELLGLSFAYRYLQKFVQVELPENCYQGEYIVSYLEKMISSGVIPADLLLDAGKAAQLNREDWLSRAAKFFSPLGIRSILSDQQADLKNFRTEFDAFFSEATLHEKGAVLAVGEKLKQKGKVRTDEGAQVFVSTEYGDDKDRVIVRSDGRPTYLLADIAYHADKISRGYKSIIDIWGPDHHGYIARLSGALQALGFGDKAGESFKVIIAQQVNLLENGEPVVMSKRLGKFQTMRDLIEKIPVDVCRYFFVTRALSTHLDFDLTLALDQSKKNPVYYVQYANARIHSIFREAGFDADKQTLNSAHLAHELIHGLNAPAERKALFFYLLRFPELVHDIARNSEIQRLPEYLYQLSTLFTSFYHGKNNRIKDLLSSAPQEADALLNLCLLTTQVLEQGLALLGITAPREMHRDEE
ncbi:MAG: arginine--tRNA ligase [Turneriella sp.]